MGHIKLNEPGANFTDEELHKLEAELHKANVIRNTMTESEFNRFKPLYQKNADKILTGDVIATLSSELSERISLYEPLYIVSDTIDSKGNRRQLFTLPPIFTRCDTVNRLGRHGTDTMTWFTNALGRDSAISTEPERATKATGITVKAAQDIDRLKEDAAKFKELADAILNLTETTKPKASVDKPTDTVSDGFMDGFDFE